MKKTMMTAMAAALLAGPALAEEELAVVGSWSSLPLYQDFTTPFWTEMLPEMTDGDSYADEGTCAANPCPADVNGDGVVGGADLTALLASWGDAGGGTSADLDGDGTVGGADLAIMLAAWGTCGG